MVSIYVLPTEEDQPPRAVLTQQIPVAGESGDDEAVAGLLVGQALAIYADGIWVVDGEQVPEELASAITEHAKSLGVQL